MYALLLGACGKDDKDEKAGKCDIEKTRRANEAKVTIANGLWGTLGLITGNCMPVIDPANTSCKSCPVKRTMRIYSYTTLSQASQAQTGPFFDSFSTTMLKEFKSDSDGFFEITIEPGTYTAVAVEDGKLYAFSFDGQGGISPIVVAGGKQQFNPNVNKAAW